MRYFSTFFLRPRFFFALGGLVALFCSCYFLPDWCFFAAQLCLFGFLLVTVGDGLFLYTRQTGLHAVRNCSPIFSLGSENNIHLHIQNQMGLHLFCNLLDELPAQFQKRDFELSFELLPHEEKNLHYKLVPKTRGEYAFGNIHLYCHSRLGLVEKRVTCEAERKVNVYPSIIEMKKHQLIASQRLATQTGLRKIRRIGHSYDFDHIKEYARGDDPRSINWKATSKLNRLMVNHYEDQKSQQIYSILDLGRNMSSPFNEMSLLDYCINATLVLSRIILQKDDKAGMLAIGDKTHQFVQAERGNQQLSKMMSVLYNLKETEGDANPDRLYQLIRSHIRIRSLLMYYTNVESLSQLERILPLLERIKSHHLLVVVMFENAEIADFTREKKSHISDIYAQTISRKYLFEKQQIAHRLRRSGIYTILTPPNELTINSINQYLELKARGLI